ncbi:DUF2523 domain-containing protein [Vibrio cionasavignyae]|uniref:DUF2523 domain-containing protein n=1 Tax=Vibrio cionasavignyae TaxID=2910252 RepID=UPI003D134928
MPYFITFLATIIVPLIPSIVRGLVSYVAVSLGFSLVAYTGISKGLDLFRDYIQNELNGLAPDVAAIVGMSGFPESVNAILTCIVFSFTLSGMMKATGYKPSWRSPS